jgi:hypothetical protein
MPLLYRLMDPARPRRAEVAAFSVAAILWGSTRTLIGMLRGRHVIVTGLRTVARGLGALAGVWGYVYEEYG